VDEFSSLEKHVQAMIEISISVPISLYASIKIYDLFLARPFKDTDSKSGK
jgi:hypothetical protein